MRDEKVLVLSEEIVYKVNMKHITYSLKLYFPLALIVLMMLIGALLLSLPHLRPIAATLSIPSIIFYLAVVLIALLMILIPYIIAEHMALSLTFAALKALVHFAKEEVKRRLAIVLDTIREFLVHTFNNHRQLVPHIRGFRSLTDTVLLVGSAADFPYRLFSLSCSQLE